MAVILCLPGLRDAVLKRAVPVGSSGMPLARIVVSSTKNVTVPVGVLVMGLVGVASGMTVAVKVTSCAKTDEPSTSSPAPEDESVEELTVTRGSWSAVVVAVTVLDGGES